MNDIEIINVSKKYGGKKRGTYSVKDLNLTVKKGTVFGFLGPNGAGKTTTIKMLVGLAYPTQGEIKIKGKAPTDVEIRKHIGFMPESPAFYLHLTGKEFLEFVGNIFTNESLDSKIHVYYKW